MKNGTFVQTKIYFESKYCFILKELKKFIKIFECTFKFVE